jgi:hypothetical protein
MSSIKRFWKRLIGFPDYQTFEKDYLLLHEILETLRRSGLSIRSVGTEEKGHTPFYEFSLPSARLHFGTLVALLNEPDKYRNDAGQIIYLHNISAKIEEVKIIKYEWVQVSEAIEALAVSEEVNKEVKGDWLEPETKIIILTAKGLGSLNSKKYLKKYQKERNAEILFRSTVSTNLWMRIFTGVLAVSALFTFIIQLPTCTRYKPEAPIVVKQSKCKRYGIDSIYILNDSLPPLRGENSKEPLGKK